MIDSGALCAIGNVGYSAWSRARVRRDRVYRALSSLPFARSSDGGCSNRTVVRNRANQGWE